MIDANTKTLPSNERLPALDFVRGVCVLLMLPATIPWFCRPFNLWETHPLPDGNADRIIIALTLFFVDHKVLTLFALLFGMGLGLQLRRPSGQDKPFLIYYLWRMGVLFFLGVAHILLFWWGDLLTTYAFVGLHAIVLAVIGGTTERLSIFVCFAWFYACLMIVGFFSLVPMEDIGGPDLRVPHIAVASGGPPQSLFRGEGRAAEKVLEYIHPNNQQRIYRDGTLVDAFEHRMVLHFKEWLQTVIFSFWYLLGCALLGLRFVRWGLLDGPNERWRVSRWFVILGLAIGVPTQLIAAAYYFWELGLFSWCLSEVGALPMGLLYLALLLAFANTGRLALMQASFRAVGRLALSNYLAQSLLAVVIFHRYGFRLYGLPLTSALLIAGGIAWLQLIASLLWLRAFREGPAEWLWRCLAARLARAMSAH